MNWSSSGKQNLSAKFWKDFPQEVLNEFSKKKNHGRILEKILQEFFRENKFLSKFWRKLRQIFYANFENRSFQMKLSEKFPVDVPKDLPEVTFWELPEEFCEDLVQEIPEKVSKKIAEEFAGKPEELM